MLILSRITKITEGTERAVHMVPGDKSLLVKVKLQQKIGKQSFLKKLVNYIHPAHTRLSLREISEDLRIQANARLLGVQSPIVPTRGLIQTSKGLGLLVDRIGPKSGGLAPTLQTLNIEGKLDSAKLEQLNIFATTMFQIGVIANDLQPENIIWDKATNSFFIVDGFGERNLIKLKTYFKYIRNRKQNTRFTRLAHKLGINWQIKGRKFSF